LASVDYGKARRDDDRNEGQSLNEENNQNEYTRVTKRIVLQMAFIRSLVLEANDENCYIVSCKVLEGVGEEGFGCFAGIGDVADEIDDLLVFSDVPKPITSDDQKLIVLTQLRLGRVR